MSTNQFSYNPFLAGINEIRGSWGWVLAAGIALMVFGAVCVAGNIAATFATVFVLGWLLLFGGIVSLVQAFRVRTWNGFFLLLLSALLRGFTGYLLIRYPIAGAITLTLILASFFIVSGLFRTIGSAMIKFPRWGWSAFSGVVAVVLGIMLLAGMPVSSVWFIGFAIGLDMILEGVSLAGFAMAMHSMPKLIPVRTKAA